MWARILLLKLELCIESIPEISTFRNEFVTMELQMLKKISLDHPNAITGYASSLKHPHGKSLKV